MGDPILLSFIKHSVQLLCAFFIVEICLVLKLGCTSGFLIDILNHIFIINRFMVILY